MVVKVVVKMTVMKLVHEGRKLSLDTRKASTSEGSQWWISCQGSGFRTAHSVELVSWLQSDQLGKL